MHCHLRYLRDLAMVGKNGYLMLLVLRITEWQLKILFEAISYYNRNCPMVWLSRTTGLPNGVTKCRGKWVHSPPPRDFPFLGLKSRVQDQIWVRKGFKKNQWNFALMWRRGQDRSIFHLGKHRLKTLKIT